MFFLQLGREITGVSYCMVGLARLPTTGVSSQTVSSESPSGKRQSRHARQHVPYPSFRLHLSAQQKSLLPPAPCSKTRGILIAVVVEAKARRLSEGSCVMRRKFNGNRDRSVPDGGIPPL
jgi:hypothetical protein